MLPLGRRFISTDGRLTPTLLLNKGVCLVVLLLLSFSCFPQTPGLIFQKAGTGASVLDPNGDGYCSATSSGFFVNDISESEIPYKPLPLPSIEPSSDVGSGTACGSTDLVDSGTKNTVFSYVDGAGNILFRFRLGSSSSNNRGYSILLDTDQKFGFSGASADPNAVAGNPGFEIEIVLRTNIGVSLYDVNGTTTPVLKTTLAYVNYAQKCVAFTTNCSDADYFYDFYIPFATITTFFPSITTSTPLRMAAATSSVASPVIGNNSISDAAGINDNTYSHFYDNIFQVIVDNFYPTSATQINSGFPGDRSACPSITGNITVSSTTINGTSTEASGTIINIYKNNSILGSTTVSSGAWSLTGASGLVSGDVINATALASGKSESTNACNTLAVGAPCSTDVTITSTSGKNINGMGISGATVKVYQNGTLVPANPASFALIDATGNFCWKSNGSSSSCSSGMSDLSGEYTVTQTELGKCESPGVTVCMGKTQTAAPVITTNPILTSTTSISGTAPLGSTVYLYVNGIQAGSILISLTNWTISGLTLTYGQVITAKARTLLQCTSNASASITVTMLSAAPFITGTYCTPTTISSVTGITTEAGGTTVQVFSNGTSVGSTTSNSSGSWTMSGLSLSPGAVITATATAPGKLVSVASVGVTIKSISSNAGLTVNSPIAEGATTLSGTVSGSGTVKVYIDGGLLGTATVSGSSWTLAGLSSTDVYAGGLVTATLTIGTNCESNLTSGVTVQCNPPATGLSVTPATVSLCEGSSTSITIGASENGVIYQLYIGAAPTGVSKTGTGGNLALTSGVLTNSALISVKAIKASSPSCTSTLVSKQSVTITPTITSNTLVGPSTATFCGSGDPGTISGSIPLGNGTFSYQWQSSIDNITFTDISGAIARDYNPPGITATRYYRRTVISGGCTSTSASLTITVQPTDLTNAISTSTAQTVFCANDNPPLLNGSTPTGGAGSYTYQWQSSIDNATFNAIGSATSVNYDPPAISQTTFFRRLVNSGSCLAFPSSSIKLSVATTAETLISASPTSIIANGSSTSAINVQLKDALGMITSGGCTPVLFTTTGTLSSVVNNNNGTFSATLTAPTTTGTATITGSLNGLTIADNEVVTFLAGPASVATTTITAASASITANGVSTTLITVQTKDANGNNLTTNSAAVTLSTTLGSLSSVTSAGNGAYTAVLTSSVTAGTATITGTLNTIGITDNELVKFINTTVDPSTSTITATPTSIPANGTSTTVITVQAKNSSGVAVTIGGASVNLFTTLGSLSLVTDNLDGTYTATLTSSTTSGIATITGTVNGTSIASTATVTFTAGPASAATSIITATPTSITANGISTSLITVQTKDANGNLTTTASSVVLNAPTSGSLSPVINNGNGTYSATLTSSATAGVVTIAGTVNGTSISNTVNVNFTPGPASGTTSIITASPTSITADGVSTSLITVQTKDANGNLTTTASSVVLNAPTSGSLSAVVNNGNGTYSATLTSSTTAGVITITGTVNGTSISNTATVTFAPGSASAATSIIAATPTSITADGVSTSLITVQTKDANGNLTSIASSVVLNAPSSGSLSAFINNGNGTYSATLTSSTTARLVNITGTVNGTPISNAVTVTFTPGPASATTSIITGTPTSITADGISTAMVTVQTKDAHGNLTTTPSSVVLNPPSTGSLSAIINNGNGTYSATLTSSTTAGAVTITGTVNGASISNTATVTFTPGSATAGTSVLTATPTSIIADGVSTALLTVQTKDVNGNLTTTASSVMLNPPTSGSLSAVVNNGNGTYSATLTSSTTAAVVTITGTVNGALISTTATVTFTPRPASAVTSLMTATPTSIIADGESTALITVQTNDVDGNVTTAASSVVLNPPTSGSLSAVINNGDGTYSATLTSSTTATKVIVSGTVDGAAIANPPTVDFIPGPANAATTSITVSSNAITADGISNIVITVQLQDAHGNKITSGGATVNLITTAGTLSPVVDNNDGTYTFTLTTSKDPAKVIVTASVDGTPSANQKIVYFVPVGQTISANPSEIKADGISTSVIQVLLKNADGNPLPDMALTMKSTAGKLADVIDHGDGTYTANLTSSTASETAVVSYLLFDALPGDKTVEVTFIPQPTFFIPEGFSPDGDGTNDLFIIQGAEAFTITLTVYNRWGNIVYESTKYKNDWDGSANQGLVIGDKLPDGTYYYIVDLNNGKKPFVRFLTIKRK